METVRLTMAQALLRFCAEPDLVAPMGAASRRLAEERFDVTLVNTLLLEAMGLAPAEASRG